MHTELMTGHKYEFKLNFVNFDKVIASIHPNCKKMKLPGKINLEATLILTFRLQVKIQYCYTEQIE